MTVNGCRTAAYAFPRFCRGCARYRAQIARHVIGKRAAVAGASLGGIASLTAEGFCREGGRAARCFVRLCWSTSRHGWTRPASPRCRASCASTPMKDLPRWRRPPTPSPPICHTGRGRVPTKGLKKNLRLASRRALALALGPEISRQPQAGRPRIVATGSGTLLEAAGEPQDTDPAGAGRLVGAGRPRSTPGNSWRWSLMPSVCGCRRSAPYGGRRPE